MNELAHEIVLPTMQSRVVGLLACAAAAQGTWLAPPQPPALRTQRVAAPVKMIVDPVTASAAFLAGAIPSSFVAYSKDQQLQESQKREKELETELKESREAFNTLMVELEMSTSDTDEKLADLLRSGAKKARKSRESMQAVKDSYREQVRKLKELVGDYTDKLELQQNTFRRQSAIVESASGEASALKERALLLQSRLAERQKQLEELSEEVEELGELKKSSLLRIVKFFGFGGKK